MNMHRFSKRALSAAVALIVSVSASATVVSTGFAKKMTLTPSETALEEIEEKTGLIRRFSETQKGLEKLDGLVGRLLSLPLGEEASLMAEDMRRQIRSMRG